MNRKSFIANTAAGIATLSAISTLVAQEHNHEAMKDMKTEPGKYSKALMSALHCELIGPFPPGNPQGIPRESTGFPKESLRIP